MAAVVVLVLASLLSFYSGCGGTHAVSALASTQGAAGDEAAKAHARICAAARCADRIECEVFTEIQGLVRVAPIIIKDKEAIEVVATELAKLKSLKANEYVGGKSDGSPYSARVVLICTEPFKCERFRLYANHVVVFPEGEPFEGMLIDKTLADFFHARAVEHARQHPEDLIPTE